ncbi:MAG: transposase [Candidatus Bathyarchaeota archaeon]|nr:transposase [Candidatus Bathyarchaeota archaeon]
MKFVGIDVGKYKCTVAVMDSEGRISDEFAFHNNNEGIGGLISRLSMDDRVLMESTGSVWANLYDRLEKVHIKVVLANPLKTKAIASARIKSDKVEQGFLRTC